MILAPVGEGLAPKQFAPYAGMGLVFVEPLVGCCFSVPTGYHSTAELGKILFNFSNNTSLKLSYLGGQSVNGNGDVGAYDTSLVGNTGLPAFSFEPCGPANTNAALTCNPFATGSPYSCTSPSGPACGKPIPFDLTSLNGEGYTWNQQNLFQGELRTTLGQTGTVLARYYTGALNTYATLGSATPLNVTLQSAYGSLPLCPIGASFDPAPPSATNPNGFKCVTAGGAGVAPTNTAFTGQSVNLRTASQANTFFTNDTMSGETLEVQEQLGDNTFTLAYDRSQQNSSSTEDEPSVGLIILSPVKGSKQTIQTISLRGTVVLKPKLLLNFGDYLINYVSHYSIDCGIRFNDSSHTYNAPRAAFTWQPSNDTIYRFATGASIAPPYITLVSSGGPSWSQIIGGVPSAGWTQNANNGNINAETAWGYDLGADHRIARDTAVSVDFYLTQLHNLFLTQTTTVTGAAAAGCPNQPCQVSKTANLGQARYEGIELGVNHVPLYGLGWSLQGSLQRAFTYNLPKYFYCAGSTNPVTGVTTPPGPGCINNTNLMILPEMNFGGTATGISGAPNGIPGARVPYASGYGDVSWLGHYGQYYDLNVTYYGSNNVYNAPAFAVMGANVRFNLGNYGTKLQFSIDNLTGAYDAPYVGFFNGIPLPLVQGAAQPVAPSPAGNYGPITYRFILTQNL
jgi:hypothetical protein